MHVQAYIPYISLLTCQPVAESPEQQPNARSIKPAEVGLTP